MNRKTLRPCRLLAATTVLLATATAWADPPVVSDTPIDNPNPLSFPAVLDKKVMPGIACQPEFGAHVGNFHRAAVAASNDGEKRSYLENTAAAGRRIVCPLVRDNSRNTSATIGVTVVGHSANTLPFACYVNSYDESGVLLDSAGASNVALGDFVMTLDPGSPGLSVSSNNGFYLLWCTMTSGSRLYSYRWSEPLSTDDNR